MSTKLKIQTANNGLILIIDQGFKDEEESKEVLVFEDGDFGDKNKAIKSLLYKILESLGSNGGKYADRNLRIIDIPGRDFSGLIEDKDYILSLQEDAYAFLMAIKNQKEAYKNEKKKFPKDKWDMFSGKLDQILKILD
jgi:hypothetical protein